ncbi:hypothetical protein [Aestuariicoccus sp. MJ-SS9]|uniref:hypothetical protein n=1 Tax=Aestuariicoccus sp. MJ-SS9 TaxID=3079855 RepID=UPI00292E0611|nr:hypothetical protein [Aestuariicoccus sp. MJ-SS9]
MLEVYRGGKLLANAYPTIATRMVYPNDEVSAQQALSVMELETRRRDGVQGPIMKAVEAELVKTQSLGRMAGDVALAMINEQARGRVASLEYASTFVAHYFETEQTADQKFPTDVRRLQDHFRRLRDSLHLWAAWQLCQNLVGFDFVRNPGHTKLFLQQAGLAQISLSRIPYFGDWNPWAVPKEIIQIIQDRDLRLRVLEDTDFEREFRKSYHSRQGR